ncbi:cation diffusion facilitator family transporter [Schnuerera sp. xch1]|uniref:cation diffusion facilitator family transporter n=1 Tax=Schnuerera sp. xch1 TaxID=2874283 RepID=UPI001CBF384A|nr:cation diffusion facilitator family transporter [Schnuerera sp. xch1]MBZ2175028.1 cation diffusion facilitator family transporter [Schnuerera sp. xch1]
MPHNHSNNHHNYNNQGNIRAAFLLNLSFTIFEIIGGFWTNSMAILSDALHDLGDSLSLGISWSLERYSKKGPDKRFSYGYARFSLLGALINSLILISGSAIVLVRAIPRILNPQSINSSGMLIFAIIGIIVNGVAALKLRKGTSFNEKVVSWHLIEDILGWLAILIASIILMFVNIPVIDPILSVLITAYILYNVIITLKQILNILLQGVPKNLPIDEIEKQIVEKTNALSVHHTHIWSLEGEKNLLSTHIVVEDNIKLDDIIKLKQEIRKLMNKKGIQHVTVEVEFNSEDCDNYFDY